MSFLYPLGAAVLQAASATLDKVTLSIKGVTYKTYTGVSFPLIFLFTLIIFLIIKPTFALQSFNFKIIFLIIISTVFIIGTNLLYYRALKHDLLSEMQTFSLLSNIPLILLTIIFLKERNPLLILLAFICVIALVWSHYERRHFKISKNTLPYFIWIILIAPFGGIMSKIILQTIDPISLQLIRDGIIALIFMVLFFKNIKRVPRKAYFPLLLTNILTSIAWILYFLSYQKSGIIYTVLIFSIQPLLVYITSIFLLKEKTNFRKITAFVIILICIGVAQLL
ncbi:MAG: EamA family transporter [Candidatus Pacearchaeota archaeon]|jgi:uncharacterized membrane protein